MNHLNIAFDVLCKHLKKLRVGNSVVVDAGKIQEGTFTHIYDDKKYVIVVDECEYATITRIS